MSHGLPRRGLHPTEVELAAPMLIRAFRQSDMPAARELLCQLGYDIAAEDLAARMVRVLDAPGHRVVAARLDGRIAGLMHVFIRPALEKPCEAIVQALVVDEAYRGQGVGEALMRDAEAWAAGCGVQSVALYTRHAGAFYARLGYDRVATAGFMRKRLGPSGRREGA